MSRFYGWPTLNNILLLFRKEKRTSPLSGNTFISLEYSVSLDNANQLISGDKFPRLPIITIDIL